MCFGNNLSSSIHDFYASYLSLWNHSAFSTVVADGQFSTLGTVLLAALAATKKATVFVKRRDFVQQREAAVRSEVNSNDVGELVQREVEEMEQPDPLKMPSTKAEVENNHESPNETSTGSTLSTPAKRSRTKRRSRLNAIDDLFDSLR